MLRSQPAMVATRVIWIWSLVGSEGSERRDAVATPQSWDRPALLDRAVKLPPYRFSLDRQARLLAEAELLSS